MLFRFPTENEIAYHYPDASKVKENLNRALSNPDDHYHFATSLKSIYQWVVLANEFDEDPHDKIDALLDDLSISHPSVTAAAALTCWETDREYRDAVAALHLLRDSFEKANAEGWHRVAQHIIMWLIRVTNELNRDLSPVVNDAAQYIEDHFADASDLPLNTYRELVSTIYEHQYDADDSAVLQTFVTTIQHANRYASQGEPRQEQMLLEDALELAKVSAIDQRGLERRYVATYRKRAELQSDSVVTGETLRKGLEDPTVAHALSDAEKQDWKCEMNEAYRKGAERLRREGTPLHTDEMDDAIWADVERKSRIFKQLVARYSRKAALYWFASHDQYYPPEDRDNEPIFDHFPTVSPSDTGHVVQQPGNGNAGVTQSYLTSLAIYASLAPQSLYSLIDDGVVTRGLLYGIFLDCGRITDDDLWYVMGFIDAVFEERYDEAVHLGVPRLEAMIFHVLQSKGEDVDALMDTGTGTRTMGSLLDVLEEYVDPRFHKYLTYMYNDRLGELAGGNIRNRISHGHLRMRENTAFLSHLILMDMIRLVILTDLEKYRAKFGLISEFELLDHLLR